MAKKKPKAKSSHEKIPVVMTAKTWNSLPGFEFYIDREHLVEHKFWVNAEVSKALKTLRADAKIYVIDVVRTATSGKKLVETLPFNAWLDEFARPV